MSDVLKIERYQVTRQVFPSAYKNIGIALLFLIMSTGLSNLLINQYLNMVIFIFEKIL